MRLSYLIALLFLLPACQSIPQQEESSASSPNIILILADDMGYSDLGCMGAEIETPNLDALADNGMLFTHAYNTSRCCPTRASLLTGLYQHDAGYGHMDSDLGSPSYQGRFKEGVVSMPELLQQADYQTYMLGKWHLGHEVENTPLNRGFDRMYGIPKGGGLYFYPCIGRDRQVYLDKKQVFPDSNWYSTDAFTDYAIQFIGEADQERPFFMYLAYVAPHFPLQARAEDIQKYRGKYEKGYESIRQNRFEKQQQLGIISREVQLSPADFDRWESLENQSDEELKMAVYAAQVDRMDQNIGRLMESLKKLNLFENTLVLFLSDNGATDVELNTTPGAEFGSRNSWSAYGKNWANVSNTPYRKYKAMTHEGGIITPMIAHWPKGIQQRGSIQSTLVHVLDVLPTFLEVADVEYPSEKDNIALKPLEGKSFLPTLKNEKTAFDRVLLWEHEGNQAVRKGDWKLVRLHNETWELYDLKNDPIELRNVVDDYPEKVKELEQLYKDWAKAKGVRAWPIQS
ncbi:MAG: arylsulfatase [Bacteroidota bacterium]